MATLTRGLARSDNSPLLTARSRVVVVEDRESIEAFTPRPSKIAPMIERGLMALTGKRNTAEAWRSIVSTQDVVGIKVFSAPGDMSGTRPAVVACLVQSLQAAGIRNLIIWDKHYSSLRAAGYVDLAERLGVQACGSAEEGYDESAAYEMAFLGKPVWGDLEFGKTGERIGRKSYVTKLLTKKITKIINITPLLNHNHAGVSGNLYGLSFGSVDNVLRFELNPDRMATAIPEIYALPELFDRVVLNIVDALICQYQGEESTRLHYSTMLGQLRFSMDPVALDVLSVQELNHQRQLAKIAVNTNGFQIYTNATLLEIGVSDLRRIDVHVLRADSTHN